MYLVNSINQTIAQLFIASTRFRTGVELQGVKDGANATFTVAAGDKFTHNLPFFSIAVYWNGQRLKLIDDYTIVESGGATTGFDTIVMEVAPIPEDMLIADYIALDAPV